MRNFLNDVIPVVVTYNAEIKVLDDLLNSLQLFDKVQLVDNGSNSVAELKELCSKYANLAASFLPANVGLAEAQNLAVDSITTNDACAFIILFDQDSVPVGNCIEVLHNHAIKLIDKGTHLGVIGPELVDSFSDSRFGFIRKGKRFYKEDTTTSVFQCDGINSSGSLIPLAFWKELGGNNSQLFIDHVETDWCFRARALGYVCYGTFEAELSHSMGESTIDFWFFGKRSMPDRTPERHYYLFRNSMFLQKKDYVPPLWKLSNILKLIFTFLYFVSFSSRRLGHLRNMSKGLIDGFKCHFGEAKK